MKKLIVIFIVLTVCFQAACGRLNPENKRDRDDETYSESSSRKKNKSTSKSTPETAVPTVTPYITENPYPGDDNPSPDTGVGTGDSDDTGYIVHDDTNIYGSNPVMDKDNILIAEAVGDVITVLELTPEGTVINEVFSAYAYRYFPFSVKDQLLFLYSSDGLFLYDFNTETLYMLPQSVSCQPVGFLKQSPCVVYSNRYMSDLSHQVIIYDYVNERIVRKLTGYNAKISAMDDSVYFLNYHPEEDYYYSISISSYDPDTGEVKERYKELMDDYTYDITDVAPLSMDYFAYCIYNEHEYRYHTSEGYVIATKGNLYSEDISKEQFDLVFSPDGKMACMTERDWGSLTYIAYGDYTSQEMFQSEYYESFPEFHNGLIYFVSDPGFVNAKEGERSFRQIEVYALYCLDPVDNSVTEIYRTRGDGFMFLKSY